MDTHTYPLEIDILANHFPEREANLDERRLMITERVREVVPEFVGQDKGFVWVVLAPASFEMI